MSVLASQRTCALILVVTFMFGTTVTSMAGGVPRCKHCAPDCPMHTGHAGQLGCHHGAPAEAHQSPHPDLRCACGHHPETSSLPVFSVRAILPMRSGVRPILRGARLAGACRILTTQFVPEPPKDPPRARVL